MLPLGIALVASASLLLEVTLTRIFTVGQGHHFASLVVSTALLGIGASGAWLMLLRRPEGQGRAEPPSSLVVVGPVLFTITAVTGYLAVNRLPFDLVRVAWEPWQMAWLFLAYAILAVPFFFSGLTVATALTRMAHEAGRLYGADLLGAATGALLPLALYPVMGATGALLAAGWLGVAAAVVFWLSGQAETLSPARRAALGAGLLLAMVLLVGGLMAPSWYAIRLSPYRGLMAALNYPEAAHLMTRWNALARLDVVSSPAVRFAPGLSLTYEGALPPQVGVTVDGDQLHAVTAAPVGQEARLDFLRFLPAAAPYHIATPRRVLVIEPGGGLDVLMALWFGADALEVVEPNPALVEIVRAPAPGIVSRIYDDPFVTVHLGEARAVLRGPALHDARYDLIVFSPLHALGASGQGLYGFAEDYSLTREAVAEYYGHVADGGWLVMTRYLPPVPLHDIRLAATLIEALEDQGIPSPAERLIVLRSWGTLTLMVKRGPVTPIERDAVRLFAQAMRFDLDSMPGIRPEDVNRFNRFAEPVYYRLITQLLDPGPRARLYEAYPFEIRPATDDRPFFGYVVKLSTLREAYRLVRETWLFFIEGGFLLPVMVGQAALLAAVLILLPAILGSAGRPPHPVPSPGYPQSGGVSPVPGHPPAGHPEGRRPGEGGVRVRTLLYFLLIALGFMGVEIAMIQRLALLLGHPLYAVSAVLAALLGFAGLGSRLTAPRRLGRMTGRGHRLVLLVLGLVVIGAGAGLPLALAPFMGLPVEGRFAVAIAGLAPPGLLMGMPFPLGIRALEQSGRRGLIPWAWAVNGATSVVAAMLAAFFAMEIGLTGVLLAAGIAYLAAGWCVQPGR